MANGDYPPADIETVLRDSGLFTQVEPEYEASSAGRVTYCCRRRGVVASIDRAYSSGLANPEGETARIYIDHMGDTYQSHGWYDYNELKNLVLPVMASDEAWTFFIRAENKGQMDFSLASERVR
jgi:hypothetical protein